MKKRCVNSFSARICVFVAMMIAAACHADTKTVWRDAQGRVLGTATTDSYGKTTYRDAQGRVQGTKTTNNYGKTTYRDAQGRVRASATK